MSDSHSTLFRHEGFWRAVLVARPEYGFIYLHSPGPLIPLEMRLRDEFARWLTETDPTHTVLIDGYLGVVTFSNENAAMQFALTYNVRIKREAA